MTDLPPSSLGSALLAPIERMQLEPELGGSQPCLGYGAIEVVYTQILGRSSPAQK